MPVDDIRSHLGLRPVINVSGTMTSLGASIVVPAAVEALSRILTEFVEMADLHRKASAVIAELTGAEAGFITASCSATISLAVAASMTGPDLAAIERLPDTAGLKDGSSSSPATWSATAHRSNRRSVSPGPRSCRSVRRPAPRRISSQAPSPSALLQESMSCRTMSSSMGKSR